MSMRVASQAIDCDVHPTVPDIAALLPYLDDFWREQVLLRGISSLESGSYPPKAPITCATICAGRAGRARPMR